MAPRSATRLASLATALVATCAIALTGLATLPTTAASAQAADPARVISRDVVFSLRNSNDTDVACAPDGALYDVRATLIGPERQVLGSDGGGTINVLVHDLGTGGWFWRLRNRGTDYATALARAGQTSLVLDRLGYDASPLADGRDTCLGAQATMLHELIQHLYSGTYLFTAQPQAPVPHATHVITHGHGVGAAITQLEAASFDDVDGLVLMSWADTNASQRAITQAGRATLTCASGAQTAPYGQSAAEFRSLLFSSALRDVRERATRLRNAVPCGDVTSLSTLLLASTLTTGRIEVPVLLLFGADDALNREGAAQRQAARFTGSPSVTTRTFAHTGSALPLEKAAPQVRATVLRWLAER